MPATPKPPQAVAVARALEDAAALRPLRARIAASAARLEVIRPLLPAALRTAVVAGPIDDDEWCLLVPHSAAAAKVRQLLPALSEALAARGHPARAIRIRVNRAPASR